MQLATIGGTQYYKKINQHRIIKTVQSTKNKS
jgi:hypothetical protein